MDKIQILNLVLEVTRNCNIQCSHCLRGAKQNKNIDTKYIDSLLSQVDYISSITFSGGEPSLNVKAIDYFLAECIRLKIGIGGFYIATNGINIKESFVISCLRLYFYCDEKEMCSVQVSNDYYHAEEDNYNTDLLSGLSFFNRKHEQEAEVLKYPINEGFYAENYGDGKNITVYDPIESVEAFNNTSLYLNCNGEIINDCDWSYENQSSHKLCNVNELTNFYKTLTED